MVRTDGAILEIGTISSSTVGASINQAVKKSGRTTGLIAQLGFRLECDDQRGLRQRMRRRRCFHQNFHRSDRNHESRQQVSQ